MELRRHPITLNAAPLPDATNNHGTDSDVLIQLNTNNIALCCYAYDKHTMAPAKAPVIILNVALLCQMCHSTHPVPRLKAPKDHVFHSLL